MSLYNFGDIDRREVPVHEGEVVGVIGCGNVGMDAARTALRMGAKVVYVIYHKTENEMSALRSEYEDAVAEGVKFYGVRPLKNLFVTITRGGLPG